MAQYKWQHVLPESYLRAFVDPERVRIQQHDLWVYRAGEEPKPRGPKGVASHAHFYTTDEIDDPVAVEKMLAVIEGDTKPHLEKLRAGNIHLTPQEKAEFATYIGVQLTRTPLARERANAIWIDLTRQGFRKTLDEGTLPALVAEHEAKACERIGTDLDSLQRFARQVADGEVEMTQTSKGWTMKHLFQQAVAFGDTFERMHWALLEAPTSDVFITSDNPVHVTDPTAAEHGPKGFSGSRQMRFSFTLSPRFMLYGDFLARPDELAMSTAAEVQQSYAYHITQAFEEIYASFRSDDLKTEVDRVLGSRPPLAWKLPSGALD